MIKNKNGTEFVLSKPNPLSQESWKDKIILHNVYKKKLIMTEQYVVPKEIKKEEEKKIVEELIPEPILPVEKPNINKNIIMAYYLEATTKIINDPLYNENKTKIIYKEKTIIEILFVVQNDINLYFWTTKDLNNNSIIFPFKYKNEAKLEEFRWWKIDYKETEKDNGFIYKTVPSDLQPLFE